MKRQRGCVRGPARERLKDGAEARGLRAVSHPPCKHGVHPFLYPTAPSGQTLLLVPAYIREARQTPGHRPRTTQLKQSPPTKEEERDINCAFPPSSTALSQRPLAALNAFTLRKVLHLPSGLQFTHLFKNQSNKQKKHQVICNKHSAKRNLGFYILIIEEIQANYTENSVFIDQIKNLQSAGSFNIFKAFVIDCIFKKEKITCRTLNGQYFWENFSISFQKTIPQLEGRKMAA